MIITLIHPSRNRPKEARNTCEKWWMRRSLDPFHYILSLDNSDEKLSEYKFSNPLISDNKSAIEAINIAAKKAFNDYKSDIIVVISDDTDCPDDWGQLLKSELQGKSDFCAKTDDGLQPTLITMPIMDRIYYERYGYVYHPDYLHMFADQELTAVAMMTGKYLKIPLSFPHLHYSTGKSPKDEINVKNDSTWGHGQRLFDKHLENNFGITEPVMQYSDIQWR